MLHLNAGKETISTFPSPAKTQRKKEKKKERGEERILKVKQ